MLHIGTTAGTAVSGDPATRRAAHAAASHAAVIHLGVSTSTLRRQSRSRSAGGLYLSLTAHAAVIHFTVAAPALRRQGGLREDGAGAEKSDDARRRRDPRKCVGHQICSLNRVPTRDTNA